MLLTCLVHVHVCNSMFCTMVVTWTSQITCQYEVVNITYLYNIWIYTTESHKLKLYYMMCNNFCVIEIDSDLTAINVYYTCIDLVCHSKLRRVVYSRLGAGLNAIESMVTWHSPEQLVTSTLNRAVNCPQRSRL